MKKLLITLFVLLASTFVNAESRIIFSQDFENAVVGTNLLGNVQVQNYNSGGGASWTYDLATGAQAISGNKSAHLNIQSAGDQWWGLQFKVEDPALTTVIKGVKYRILFKIRSSTANNFCQFYVQGQSSFVQEINIPTANVTQDVSIETTAMDNSGVANFMWAFGNYANVGDVWIDDIVVTELDPPTYTPLNYLENFNSVVPGTSNVGDFEVANYGNGAWTFGVEQVGTDPANKCVRFDVTQNSDDWWTLQFKNVKLSTIKGKQYIIGFKAKSDIPNSILFRIEGTTLFEQRVNLTNAFQSFSIESTPVDATGPANFMWAFGKPTILGTFWLDDITIQEKGIASSLGNIHNPSPVKMKFVNNEIQFLSDTHAQVFVYDLTGVLVAQRLIDGANCSIPVKNEYKILIVKCVDENGNISCNKLISQD